MGALTHDNPRPPRSPTHTRVKRAACDFERGALIRRVGEPPKIRSPPGPTILEVPLEDCFVCAKHALGDAAPGGVLFKDELVYAGHAYRLAEQVSAYRGYLVAEPRRHAAGLGDLTDEEAVALGLLVNRLARALKQVAGAEHVYSFVLGDGLAHLHVVLAPRYPGTPREYWGSGSRSGPTLPTLAKMRCGARWLGSGRTSPPIEGVTPYIAGTVAPTPGNDRGQLSTGQCEERLDSLYADDVLIRREDRWLRSSPSQRLHVRQRKPSLM
jgi:histidine triad (HIT) family protein